MAITTYTRLSVKCDVVSIAAASIDIITNSTTVKGSMFEQEKQKEAKWLTSDPSHWLTLLYFTAHTIAAAPDSTPTVTLS